MVTLNVEKFYTPPEKKKKLDRHIYRSLFFKEFNVVVQIMLKTDCSRLILAGTNLLED
jgi:hypothetical protein